MKFVLIEILRGHLVVFLIVLVSYLIESNTRLVLFVKMYRIPVNYSMARGGALLHTVIYFLICLGTLLFDRYKINEPPDGYAFWKWLTIMIPLAIVFYKIYYRYVSIDPHRDNLDVSL